MTQAGPFILHVDMDAFYASVEILHDPSLAGRPVIVGGAGSRGVVASCSYEARAYGVRSAMPSLRARRLCPEAVFLPGHYDLYATYSEGLHAILTSVTPMVEGIALDEAFLDVRSVCRLWGTGPEIAVLIRQRVHAELGLWVSVGVATTKLLAKLASEAAKPSASPTGPVPGSGVHVVEPGTELAFLHPLAVQRLWGVGPATRRRLERFGVRTVGDLAAVPVDALVGALGQAQGRHLHDLAHGRDPRPVEPDRVAKSIGREETYPADHHEPEPLRREVVRLCDAVATRMRRAGFGGRTVTLKVRFGDFRTITRSRTEPVSVETGPALVAVALDLLAKVDPSPGVRLLGVSASGLTPLRGDQLELGQGGLDEEAAAAGDDDVARAVDEVRRRFGDRAVGPASLVSEGDGLDVKAEGDRHWGPPEGP